jgi:hypothetical protein
MKPITNEQIGQWLHRAALAIAPAIAATYLTGFQLGSWVHRTSNQLARFWVALWVGTTPATTATPEPIHTAPEPVERELPIHLAKPAAEALSAVTCAQLRSIVGTRSKKYKKDQLVAMAMEVCMA